MDPMGLENGGGLHPLAVVLGVVGILIMIILVSASSYQRERLQYMARKMLRKKRPSFSENQKQADKSSFLGGLPAFVQNAAETGNTRVIKRWVNSTTREFDARSAENLTALHYACRNGHNECARLLIDAGADPNVQDERSITPLHFAALGGHAVCVKILLDHHADPSREDLDHQTALDIAEKSGNIGCARLLQRAMTKAQETTTNLTLRGTTRIENTV